MCSAITPPGHAQCTDRAYTPPASTDDYLVERRIGIAVQKRLNLLSQSSLNGVGLLRFDGHPPSVASPRKGCSQWRPWSGRSPVPDGRSLRSSRLRSSSVISTVTAASASWLGTSTSVKRQCGRGYIKPRPMLVIGPV